MTALQLQDISLSAGGFKVQNISFSIMDHEYFVLMGATGSGKSLLLKAICGLTQIASGKIIIRGRDVTELEPRLRNIGYVPQDSGLFPHMNVNDNIMFSLKLQRTGTKQFIDSKSAVDRIIKSLGIEYLLERSVNNLSGGEKQKVSLARALARKPDLLILDEPVSALDEPTRREICRVLRKVQKEFGVPTIHVCHSKDEAELVSDKVGIMSNGVMVEVDLLEKLKNESKEQAVKELLNFE